MSSTYETRTKTYEHCTGTFCDLCGQEIRDKLYDAAKVTIEATRGERYPEGFYGERFETDICLPCFETKVIPALRALGLTVDWKKDRD